MKIIIPTLFYMLLSYIGFGQMIAGNAEFIIDVEEILLEDAECQADSQGAALNPHNEQTLEIDLFADGSIDLEFYAERNYYDLCKNSYSVGARIDENSLRVCGYNYSFIPVLYEINDTLYCEDGGNTWLSSAYFEIGHLDWYPNAEGFLYVEKEYIYFESLGTDSLTGWILVSNDVTKTELIVHSIGLNNEIPYSIRSTTSTNEPIDSNSLILYPNPCTEILNVDIGASESEVTKVKIYQLSDGKIVYENHQNTQLLKINTSNFNKGIYILRVEHGKQTYISKFNKF